MANKKSTLMSYRNGTLTLTVSWPISGLNTTRLGSVMANITPQGRKETTLVDLMEKVKGGEKL